MTARRPLAAAALGAAGVVLLGLAPAPAALAGARAQLPESWALTPAAAAAALRGVPTDADPVPPALVNDEVAVAELDPTGLPARALLLSRLSARGEAREVRDPASVTNVRYLDRLGRPDTDADAVLVTVGGDRPTVLTQARFDKPLPVALHAEYARDGAVVPAADVPGAAGTFRVTYTVTNTTAEQVELDWTDAAGIERTTTQPVFAPFQGSLTVTLPTGAELLEATDAVLATDADGRTVARWAIALHPPISEPIQTVSLAMRADPAAIPAAALELAPVPAAQDPGDAFAADLLDGITTGNADLYAGLRDLDVGAEGLATGSAELAGGLFGLAGGAGQVAAASDALAGGVGDLAAGASGLADASATLAEGVGDLAGGAEEVAAGGTALASALGDASGGADALAAATAQLAAVAAAGAEQDPVAPLVAGGAQIEAGLRDAAARVGGPGDPPLDPTRPIPPDGDDSCPPGGTAPPDDDCVTIVQGVRAVRDALTTIDQLGGAILARAEDARADAGRLAAAVAGAQARTGAAAQGAAGLQADLCDGVPPVLDADSCARLGQVARDAGAADGTLTAAQPVAVRLVTTTTALVAQAEALGTAAGAALASVDRVLAAVAALGAVLGEGTPDQPGLTAAMVALNAGLRELAEGLTSSQQELSAALAQVAAGSTELAGGLQEADAGAEQLAGGADQLAEGTGQAAAGAGRLARGSDALADGAGKATTGAEQLRGGAAGLASGSDAAAGAGADLAAGARQLQQEGTAPAARTVLEASREPAEAAAWLAAADARAADALPYGAPEGAVGHVAYSFTLPEVAAPRSLWERIRAMFG
jgi:putative membrane protein